MKLLSYNIQACIGSRHYSDYLFGIRKQIAHSPAKDRTLKKIGRFISGFDIVCLQELDLGGRRGGFFITIRRVEEHIRLPVWRITDHKGDPPASLNTGMRFFSRYPIDEVEEYRLPGRMRGRGLLVCTIQGHTIANTHLSLYAKMQVRQLELIREVLHGRPKTILAGDFNCRSTRPWIQDFANMSEMNLITGNSTNTYPSWKPNSDIDHIFASRSISYRKAEVLNVRLSDHLPVQTEFELLQQ